MSVDFRQCTCIPVHVLAQSMCGIRTTILCRDEFIRYRIAVCDAKSKFCDAKLNVIHRKLRCKAILTVQKNVVCVRFPCLHECMHLRTVFQCAPCDQRLYAISFYLSVSCLCAGHSILATFRICHTHVVFLIFECAVLITSCKLRLTA